MQCTHTLHALSEEFDCALSATCAYECVLWGMVVRSVGTGGRSVRARPHVQRSLPEPMARLGTLG
eukprot:scaffold199208_cov33-Tisochrysis_lutea.AAC.4